MAPTNHARRLTTRGSRAVAPLVAILIACVLGACGAIGVVAFAVTSSLAVTSSSSYCPFDVSNGMEIPTPGYTGNTSPNATSFYANGSVIFWASASGCVAPYTFTWTFGDGTHSNLLDVTHIYPGPGYYPGSLIVDDSAGHQYATYFCINATAWPNLGGGSGNPPPACP
jgi:PKD domain-containing protein